MAAITLIFREVLMLMKDGAVDHSPATFRLRKSWTSLIPTCFFLLGDGNQYR